MKGAEFLFGALVVVLLAPLWGPPVVGIYLASCLNNRDARGLRCIHGDKCNCKRCDAFRAEQFIRAVNRER